MSQETRPESRPFRARRRNALTRSPDYGNRGTLDQVDVRILRELYQGRATAPIDTQFRKSYETVAKRVGVDEETVRNRVKSYQRSGFLKGWQVVMNPSIFNAGDLALWIDVKPTAAKDDAIERARLMPGVQFIAHFHGPLFGIIFRYYDAAAAGRQIELTRKVCDAETLAIGRIPFPPCTVPLERTDWRILRAFYRDARRPYVAIAEELGLSHRTVKRRIQRMIDGAAIFGLPVLDSSAAHGFVMATLLVTYPPERKDEFDQKISSHLDPQLWHILHMLPYKAGDPQLCGFNLILTSLWQTKEISRWARKIPGLLGARVELFEGVEMLLEPHAAEVEREVARTRAAGAVSSKLVPHPP